ncbi:RNA polymerase sigma-70 factor [Pedobacter sp. SYSU D00535]|uniref:RNA polymerase sigma-70 factor n=1 Tax=Pedobacter sp. SYSU D00535 TaxID=2810308 RepID=UPI001A95C95D|nr:RNA polymerase sigma-70 factor [Pedobacter sp. SYSU D00535]
MTDQELREILIKVSFDEDRKAFKRLFFFYYPNMLKLASSFVKSNEEAEEIVDDAFIKIWQNRSKLYQVNNLKVYLFVCVKNLCFNYLEKKKRLPIISIDDIEFDPAEPHVYPEQRLFFLDVQSQVEDAVKQLTPQSQLVFRLVKEEGLKYREAAQVLNLSVKTVEYHIGNALKKIAEKLTVAVNKKK